MLGSAAVSGPMGNAKIAPTLTRATFVARVLTQQFAMACYYFVIGANFLIGTYFLTTYVGNALNNPSLR